jgi:hypothetical protein
MYPFNRVAVKLLLSALCCLFVMQANSAPMSASNLVSVRDYGALGDGKTLDTKAINQAVRACSGAGGCTLVFPPGEYVTGTFELLSNVTVYLEAGAVIRGSKNLADYGALADYGFGDVFGVNSSGEGAKMGMIVARNAKNIAIVGRGVIDGSGDDFMDWGVPHLIDDFGPQYTRQGKAYTDSVRNTKFGPIEPKQEGDGRPGTLIILSKCQNVLVRDVTLQNAPNWTLHLAGTQDAVISGVHILNSLLIPNNDGIDVFGSRHVSISDCHISAGDDDFALLNSEDVHAVNCSLESRSAAIKVESSRYCSFEDISIRSSNRGIGLFQREGEATEHLVFSNITLETRLTTGHWWGKAEPIYIAISPKHSGANSGYIRDVLFSNITGETEGGMVIYGSKDSPVEDLSFEHIRLRIRAPEKWIADAAGGNFDLRWTATSLQNAIFKHDIPGMYCRFVQGVRIRDLELAWDEGLPDYFSSGVECEDFRNLEIEHFLGKQAKSGGHGAAIVLRNGSGVSIRDSVALPGTASFLALSNVEDLRMLVGNDFGDAKEFSVPANVRFQSDYGNLRPRSSGLASTAKARGRRESSTPGP